MMKSVLIIPFFGKYSWSSLFFIQDRSYGDCEFHSSYQLSHRTHLFMLRLTFKGLRGRRNFIWWYNLACQNSARQVVFVYAFQSFRSSEGEVILIFIVYKAHLHISWDQNFYPKIITGLEFKPGSSTSVKIL